MGSLHEELSAALEGKELPEGEAVNEVEVSSETESPPVESVSDDNGRDEQGRFKKKEAEAVPVEGQEAEKPVEAAKDQDNAQAKDQLKTEEASETEARPVTPPSTWSAAAKAIFAELPEIARKEIAKRERDFAAGIQQHAAAAKGYNELMREFQPYEAMIRAEGGTPAGAISDLLGTAYRLRTETPQNKGRLVMQIAQQYGADLSEFINRPATEQQQEGQQDLSQVQQMVQQLVAPHLQKIQQWEESQTTAQQQQQQLVEMEVNNAIQAFQSATNEDGSPKHLYFENVRPLMSTYFANGQAETLEQAYDMACWANPEVRATLQAEQQRSAEAKHLEEAKRKAREARNAGFDVSGQGGAGIDGATSNSLRDELRAQFQGGRV